MHIGASVHKYRNKLVNYYMYTIQLALCETKYSSSFSNTLFQVNPIRPKYCVLKQVKLPACELGSGLNLMLSQVVWGYIVFVFDDKHIKTQKK